MIKQYNFWRKLKLFINNQKINYTGRIKNDIFIHFIIYLKAIKLKKLDKKQQQPLNTQMNIMNV